LLLLVLLFSGLNNLVSLPRFWILRYWWSCGGRGICLSEKIWSFVVLWTVFLIFFGYASLRLLWTFSSQWSKCMRWGSVIVTGNDMFFEIFQSANVEIVCVVDYFSYYCWCRWWSFGIEYSLQCPCSSRTRTLSSRRLFAIPVLECIFWRGTVVGVLVAVRSRKKPAMVCEQTWCLVQHVYLHIRLLLSIIHSLIRGLFLLVFEYLLYFFHGITEVRAFVFLALFSLKKLVWEMVSKTVSVAVSSLLAC
jgi:hypothetical protein